MPITYTYIGHGTHQFAIGDQTILVDPYIDENPATDLTADEMTPDCIIVTHGHGDHLGDTIPIARRTGCKVIANYEIINWLQAQGLDGNQLHPQHIGGGFDHGFAYVKLTIAHHGSSLPDGSYGGNPAGVLIETDESRIYVAGDTGLFLEMEYYGRNGIDLFVVPIGDNFTMGPGDALEAVRMVRPRLAVPSHYNTWPPIEQDADAWAEQVAAEVPGVEVCVLDPGDDLAV